MNKTTFAIVAILATGLLGTVSAYLVQPAQAQGATCASAGVGSGGSASGSTTSAATGDAGCGSGAGATAGICAVDALAETTLCAGF
ncbi:MAG TPA: hypothetical protein VKB06_03005 [Nitrososphaera sp.]|nr:hypothetical protein [Nitrososphaera sp.]